MMDGSTFIRFLAFILLLIASVHADLLIPNYDNPEKKLKVFKIKEPLILSCNVSKPTSANLVWKKENIEVDKIESLKGRLKIIAVERKLIIEKTEGTDAGNYSCSINDPNTETKEINVVAHVVVRLPSNIGVVEGEKLDIHCLAVGTDPEITWEYGNITINYSSDKYMLKDDENKIPNAKLTINNVSLDDRGEYKCVARNLATEYAGYPLAVDVSFVRVKGKLAALWPFLGICAEVFILCAIILIYERGRNKTELEESDTDPNAEQEKLKPQRN